MEKEIVFTSRFREEYERFPSAEFFKMFKKRYKEYAKYDNTYLNSLLRQTIENFTDLLIENKDGIELPYGLGVIRIFSYKPSEKKYQKIDPNLSKKLNKNVTFTNLNTDGRMMKIAYSNLHSKNKFTRRLIWTFLASDKLRDKASKYFRENYEKYTMLNPTRETRKSIKTLI